MLSLYRNVLLMAGIVIAGISQVWADEAPVPMPGSEAVWTYFNFDGSVDPLLPSAPYRAITTFGVPDADLRYSAGRVGQALMVSAQDAFVSVNHGRIDFPTERGSCILWFKPERQVNENAWLLDGPWASFSMALSGGRLLAYATGNSRHFLAGSLTPWADAWTGQWQMAVLTWEGDQRHLYVNGQQIAERADVEPFATPHSFAFGLHHRPRDNDNPYLQILDGAIDEFALLTTALTPEQVGWMYRQGSADSPQGILAAMGGAVAVRMPRHGFVRGETANVTVAVYGEGDTLRLSAIPEAGDEPVLLATLPGETVELTLNTHDLRPGRYRLRAELLRDGEIALHHEEAVLGIRAERRPEFPIGLDGLPPEDDALLAQAAAWHIDHTSAGGDVESALYWRLDRLFSHGIGFAPNLNVHWHRNLPLEDKDRFFDPATGRGTQQLQKEILQVLVLHGDTTFTPFSTSAGSPFAPLVQQGMRQRVERFLLSSREHPGLLAISFDDEYVFRMARDQASGKVYYGDYSPGARAFFKETTGLEPVFPPMDPPGTVFDDDHPYFKWRDTIGMPHDASCAGLAKTHRELTEYTHGIRPDVKTTTWSGGEYGVVDAVMDYAYPSIWQPHFGYNIGHGRVDFHKDRVRARQRVDPRKPLWGLVGWWSADLSDQPAHIVDDFRLNTIMSLTKGDESITWFTLYQGGILSHDGLKNEMIHWADWIHRYGPMFSRFEVRPSNRAAVLLSEDNIAGHIAHTASGIHTFGAEMFYPALRIAGVPVDVVTDEQVQAGVLQDYEALMLYRFNYASRGLWNNIQAFAETAGKQVFVDTQTALRPEGAIELPFNAQGSATPRAAEPFKDIPYYGTRTMAWMAGELRETVTPRLAPADLRVSGSDLVAPFWLHSRGEGRGRLLILVNYDTTSSQSVELFFQAPPDTIVQELEGGREVVFSTSSQPTMIWQTEIGPADWQVYWVYGGRTSDLSAAAEYRDGEFRIRAAAYVGDGLPLRAGLPVKVEVIDPSGQEIAAYRRHTALDPDTGTLDLRIPRAVHMDAAGEWRVRVTDMVSGRQASASFVAAF